MKEEGKEGEEADGEGEAEEGEGEGEEEGEEAKGKKAQEEPAASTAPQSICTIEDVGDGSYKVTVISPEEGEVDVSVRYKNERGELDVRCNQFCASRLYLLPAVTECPPLPNQDVMMNLPKPIDLDHLAVSYSCFGCLALAKGMLPLGF